MTDELRVLRMKIPGRRDRRSRYLRDEAEKFVSGNRRDPVHFSPSGMTAILFGEAALAAGHSVTLQIHPRYGVLISVGTERPWPEDEGE